MAKFFEVVSLKRGFDGLLHDSYMASFCSKKDAEDYCREITAMLHQDGCCLFWAVVRETNIPPWVREDPLMWSAYQEEPDLWDL